VQGNKERRRGELSGISSDTLLKIGYACVSPGDQNQDLKITDEYQKPPFLILIHKSSLL
jgi:hypothetical protein